MLLRRRGTPAKRNKILFARRDLSCKRLTALESRALLIKGLRQQQKHKGKTSGKATGDQAGPTLKGVKNAGAANSVNKAGK